MAKPLSKTDVLGNTKVNKALSTKKYTYGNVPNRTENCLFLYKIRLTLFG
ncbi:MAG: hypothetical protein R2777_10350 [Chitinophagales bacterium]